MAVYLICDRPYSSYDSSTLDYSKGNLVASLEQDGDRNYFKETKSGKILCWDGSWKRRDDLNHSGCFFYFNGVLASYNPEEPFDQSNGVSEFRCSVIPNA